MESRDQKSYNYEKARKRVKKIKDFYIHLAVYLLVNLIIFVAGSQDDGLLEGLKDFGNYMTAILWGIGILAHWIDVFGTNIFLGRNWEERKVKELMEKECKSTWE